MCIFIRVNIRKSLSFTDNYSNLEQKKFFFDLQNLLHFGKKLEKLPMWCKNIIIFSCGRLGSIRFLLVKFVIRAVLIHVKLSSILYIMIYALVTHADGSILRFIYVSTYLYINVYKHYL